jgi:hypothetical protein
LPEIATYHAILILWVGWIARSLHHQPSSALLLAILTNRLAGVGQSSECRWPHVKPVELSRKPGFGIASDVIARSSTETKAVQRDRLWREMGR